MQKYVKTQTQLAEALDVARKNLTHHWLKKDGWPEKEDKGWPVGKCLEFMREYKLATPGVGGRTGADADLKRIAVIGPDGKPVPAVFTVATRWYPDTSIKWLHVDFPASVPAKAGGTSVVTGPQKMLISGQVPEARTRATSHSRQGCTSSSVITTRSPSAAPRAATMARFFPRRGSRRQWGCGGKKRKALKKTWISLPFSSGTCFCIRRQAKRRCFSTPAPWTK